MVIHTDERLLTTTEVAKRLGVSPSRVQAMIRNGQLRSAPIDSRRNLVPLQSVSQAKPYRKHSGRPFAKDTAIAILYMLSGKQVTWLTKQQRYRIRRQLAQADVATLIRNLRNRGIVLEYQSSPSVAEEIRGDIRESASRTKIRNQLQLMDAPVTEGYITACKLPDITRQYRLNPDLKPIRIRLHICDHIDDSSGPMPEAFSAIDLAESADVRERIAGTNLMTGLLNQYRKEHTT